MSRRNYIHTMDALIGKPFYSNAAGAPIDPNTGLEVAPGPMFRGEQAPEGIAESILPPILIANTTEDGDSESLMMEQRKKAADLREANLTEAEKAQMQQRIELMKAQRAQREAKKLAQTQANLVVVPVPYIAPPLIISGGGGGGALGEPSRPGPTAPAVAKTSFLKKNFIPLLLVAGAIFVFIKKPIK